MVEVERCPVDAAMLPHEPPRAELHECMQHYGKGAVCYRPADAWRLAALLEALHETWRAVKDCEETRDAS